MFKPTTYRGNNFNFFRIMLHLQQTRLFFLLLFKTPSKSQHVHCRPDVFLCDHCYTFSGGVIIFFYQQVEGWVLVFLKQKMGWFCLEHELLCGELHLLNKNEIYPFGSSGSQTTEFPDCVCSCTCFHQNEMQRSAEMHLLLTFIEILLSLQKENALKFITVLNFWVRWELLPFLIWLCMNRTVGQLKCNWI